MRFPDGAPFGRQCYWMLSVHDCENEEVHQWIMYVSVGAHLVPITFGAYLLWFRWHYLWPTLLADTSARRLVRLPVDWMVACFLMACITRWLHTLLVITDSLPTFAARELFNDFSYWAGLWAVTVFLAGIIETIPPVFVRGVGKPPGLVTVGFYGESLTVWVPPRWLFIGCFTILMLWGACLTAPFTYLGGHGADIGDWELFDWGLQMGYSMWTINLLILAGIAGYYCISLLIIIRHSLRLQKANRRLSGEEMQAVAHLQRTFLYNGLVCIGGTSICVTWGFFHSQVLRQLWSSVFMELPIHIFWWPVIVLLIMKRIYSNSVQKAESIYRQSHTQRSANSTTRFTSSATRNSRNRTAHSQWDTATELENATVVDKHTPDAVAATLLGKGKDWDDLATDDYVVCPDDAEEHVELALTTRSYRQAAYAEPAPVPYGTHLTVTSTTTLLGNSRQMQQETAVHVDEEPGSTMRSRNGAVYQSQSRPAARPSEEEHTTPADTSTEALTATVPLPGGAPTDQGARHLLLRGLAVVVEKFTEATDTTRYSHGASRQSSRPSSTPSNGLPMRATGDGPPLPSPATPMIVPVAVSASSSTAGSACSAPTAANASCSAEGTAAARHGLHHEPTRACLYAPASERTLVERYGLSLQTTGITSEPALHHQQSLSRSESSQSSLRSPSRHSSAATLLASPSDATLGERRQGAHNARDVYHPSDALNHTTLASAVADGEAGEPGSDAQAVGRH
ncbi:hypothetical protein THASP1DRAFT_33182 [Thamnocephalis sphaerospora]|uniref:Uncharacterized protein n=1 Tax=Thamnocephalis sphaerospora TaxID=78915 RepID=A0A4P9XH56_9FUNG|nr:hypothetical protein THASP1DRAFT_33182 [Thamnocephalis sphaerospora]|eukprot:RKP04996.1 hypothetical protein THASP1DRAFT_33182 [Thamnocephalis sphaerospora]